MSLPRHSVSVAAVVADEEGRVLVIQRRDNGAWQIPGGILGLDESIEDGVRREVEEETGVRVDPVRLTGVYKNMTRGVVALVFRARLVSGTPQPSEESAAIEWWSVERVVTEMSETFAARVVDGLVPDGAPAVRQHDGVRLLDS